MNRAERLRKNTIVFLIGVAVTLLLGGSVLLGKPPEASVLVVFALIGALVLLPRRIPRRKRHVQHPPLTPHMPRRVDGDRLADGQWLH